MSSTSPSVVPSGGIDHHAGIHIRDCEQLQRAMEMNTGFLSTEIQSAPASAKAGMYWSGFQSSSAIQGRRVTFRNWDNRSAMVCSAQSDVHHVNCNTVALFSTA